ncbi:MAG: hypothetical protein JNL72_13995 [Flavipsychrobacter sp.]|nr:hypothetical protein [Flavipsychrobacter sp.]
MADYIAANGFDKQQRTTAGHFRGYTAFNEALKPIAETALYQKCDSATGERSGKKDVWLYVLDTASRTLWMEVCRTETKR